MIYTKWSNLIGCCALLAKNCDWFRQITPLSNLTRVSVASRGMKTYSEARIELRNLQFLKRMLEKLSQFLSLDQPNEPKSFDVPWVLQELKNTLGKLAIAVNLEAIRFEFWTERSVRDGGNLCSLWSVILKSVWNSVGDTFQLRYSWLWAVVSCILLAAVPWNGLEHLHRKARLCVYFIWF